MIEQAMEEEKGNEQKEEEKAGTKNRQ